MNNFKLSTDRINTYLNRHKAEFLKDPRVTQGRMFLNEMCDMNI